MQKDTFFVGAGDDPVRRGPGHPPEGAPGGCVAALPAGNAWAGRARA